MRMFVAKQGKETIKILFLNKGKKPLTASEQHEESGKEERKEWGNLSFCYFKGPISKLFLHRCTLWLNHFIYKALHENIKKTSFFWTRPVCESCKYVNTESI